MVGIFVQEEDSFSADKRSAKKELTNKTTERPPEIFDGLVGGNQKI